MSPSRPLVTPFVHRPLHSSKYVVITVGVVCALFFLVMAAWALLAIGGTAAIVVAILCALMAAMSLFTVALSLRTRITFRPHHIELDHWVKRRTVPREEILGWQFSNGALSLELRDRLQQPIVIRYLDEHDPRLRAWLQGLPPFDADAYILREGEGSPQERAEALARAKKQTLAVNIAGGIAAVWFLVTGHPVASTILVITPFAVCALTWFSHGLIRLHRDHPNGAPALLCAAVLLPWRTVMTTTAMHYAEVWLLAAIFGLLFSAVLFKAEPRLAAVRPAIPCVILFGLLYGYGAGMQLNTQLDLSSPSLDRARIMEKYIYRGKRERYRLRVEPWGSREAVSFIEIPRQLWQTLQAGDSVCVPVQSGALGVAWFDNRTIRACK